MKRLIVGLSLLTCSLASASESTIVLMDNTTIKTVHQYEKQLAMDSANWDDVAILKDPRTDFSCFDEAKKKSDRVSRFQAIDNCLHGALA